MVYIAELFPSLCVRYRLTRVQLYDKLLTDMLTGKQLNVPRRMVCSALTARLKRCSTRERVGKEAGVLACAWALEPAKGMGSNVMYVLLSLDVMTTTSDNPSDLGCKSTLMPRESRSQVDVD